jgi:hypothetical protein
LFRRRRLRRHSKVTTSATTVGRCLAGACWRLVPPTALLGIAGGPVAFVGGPVALVGDVVAFISGPLALVGEVIVLVGGPLPLIEVVPAPV